MTSNNNFSVLPFYGSIAERESAKPWAYDEIYPLVVSTDSFIPFFVWIDKLEDIQVSSVLIKDMEGNVIGDLSSAVDFLNDTTLNKKCVYCKLLNGLDLPEGRAYVEITYLDTTSIHPLEYHLYSDIVTCVADLSCYLRMNWYNTSNIYYEGGYIPYMDGEESTDYINILYINSAIGKPEYKFNEEGEERDGYFFASKQTSEKTYKFTFYAPESLCDAMRCIRMSDYIRITDQLGRGYVCDTFLMNVNWLEQGYYASIDAEFETDTIVKVIGKGLSAKENADFILDETNIEFASWGYQNYPIDIDGNTRGGIIASANVPWITLAVDSVNKEVIVSIEENSGEQREGQIVVSNALGVERVCDVIQYGGVLWDFRDSTEVTPPIDIPISGREDISQIPFQFNIEDATIEGQFDGGYNRGESNDFINVYQQGGTAINLTDLATIRQEYGILKYIKFENWQTDNVSGWRVNVGSFDAESGILNLSYDYADEDIEIISDGAEGNFDGIKFEIKI